ncbi:rna exonuclease [Dimargaris xerosporica]|nr:rna exonuclease [Dimargaris xerosporica]
MASKATTQWVQPPKKPGEPYLVWIDCEMTGLNPGKDKIIEIAVIVTDSDLNVVEKGPELVINQSRNLMNSMGAWCKTNHQRTGLTDAVLKSTITTKVAERTVLQFIQKHFPKPRTALLAGNSVHADREFLRHDMPQVYSHLHYRIVDVSGIAELYRQWHPDVASKAPIKKKNHR